MLMNFKHEIARLVRRIPGFDHDVQNPPAPVLEPIVVHPITDVPYPEINLDEVANPVVDIFDAPVFAQTGRFFLENPAFGRSLVSPISQALIYAILRNQRPEHVFEIGTYRGGTAEAMSRALHANGVGTLHTVGPFDSEHFLRVFDCWPEELRRRVRYYPIASMDFYMRMDQEKVRPGLVFVDGNHDYEFALFDIQCAARSITPGGFVIVDNVSQAGPYYAAVDFLRNNPGWVDYSFRSGGGDPTKAFDPNRTGIPQTDFTVLRAPTFYIVGSRPRTFGEVAIADARVNGIELSLSTPRRGMLHVQCVLRGFSWARGNVEVTAQTSVNMDGTSMKFEAMFEPPIIIDGGFDAYRAEPWLTWVGDGNLSLDAEPRILCQNPVAE